MQKLAIVLIVMILVFGCVNQKPTQTQMNNTNTITTENSTNHAGQTNNTNNLNCQATCENRESPSCAGTWNGQEVNGECSCQFTCNIPDEQTTSNNESQEINVNQSQVFDHRSIEQIMNDSVNRIKNDFYSRYTSGIFTQTTYMVIPDQIDPQNSITFGSYVELLPEINGDKDNRMIGFANVVFKDNSGMIVKIYDLFLFNESTSIIDSQENYRVSYSNKILRGCSNTGKDLIPKTQQVTYSTIVANCDRIIEEN